MNHADTEDTALPAFGEIVVQEGLNVRGPEGMQIQLACDGYRHGIMIIFKRHIEDASDALA